MPLKEVFVETGEPAMTHDVKKLPSGSFGRIVWGYVGLYTAVNLVALTFVVLLLTRRIRVKGYWRAWETALRGNMIIAANHPSSLETFVLPVLFWPMQLFLPRVYGWSVARQDAFPSYLSWLYKPFRCILVGSGGHGKAAELAMVEVLQEKGILICYPEGTRTCKATAHWSRENRRLGVFRSALPRMAQKCGSAVVPVWIDFGAVDEPLSMRACLFRVLFVHQLTVSIGEPYAVGSLERSTELSVQLKNRLLNV